MPQCAVVDEQRAAEDVSPDQRDYALSAEVRANDGRETSLETKLRESNRCGVLRLYLLAPCGSNPHRSDRRDIEGLEYREINRGKPCPGINEPYSGDRVRGLLALLL